MKIKRLLFAGLLFVKMSAVAQISSSEEFIDFSFLNPKEKYVFLLNNDWEAKGTDRNSEDGKLTEDMYYYKEENGVKYFLTVRSVLNGESTNYATILSIDNESTYNRLVKSMRADGYIFEKDPAGGDKYAMIHEEGYVIYIERRMNRDIPVYEISVIF